MSNEIAGRRWTGERIPDREIGDCQIEGCNNTAFVEQCNAEGDYGRVHWHGRIHVVGGGLKAACPRHAAEIRSEWETLRDKRKRGN